MLRVRLVLLWFAQVSRIIADNALRIVVVVSLLPTTSNAWHLVTGLLTLPAVVFAPFNGAISNSLPKRWVLVAATLAALAIVTTTEPGPVPWFLVAITMALFGPTRSAILPAAAKDTHLPLTRINGWFEMGAAVAVVAGMFLGASLKTPTMDWKITALYGFALLAIVAAFPSDLRRPDNPVSAVKGFFRDTARIWKLKECRIALLGMASLRAIVTGLAGFILIGQLDDTGLHLEKLLHIGLWLGIGVAVGSVLAGVQRHPRRILGLVPIGAFGFFFGVFLLALGVTPGPVLAFWLGAMTGLINVPLASTLQDQAPPDARGNAMAVRNFCDYGLTTLLVLALYFLPHAGQVWLLALLSLLLAALAFWIFVREWFEQVFEWILLPLYRISGAGPGMESFPHDGPVLVIANHAAWFDPFWLGKVIPRRIIAMMTSMFFDIKAIRWIFVYIVNAIRVEATYIRREVPEIQEAIAALDRGDVVMLFPEGAMRRKEEKPLKQFGQGVWHILEARPNTPVVVCWIEGNFGSYFSYYKGLPTKNKPFDFWYKIRIAVGEPRVLPPELLKDLRATRMQLMQDCLEMRKHLGLPVLKLTPEEEPED